MLNPPGLSGEPLFVLIHPLTPNDARKKEKALKTISFSKLFPYLCLFLLRLRKNEVENYADDGGKTDAGNGEGTG